MKIKTSELQGAALDWAVELIDGWQWCHDYSTNWGHGGPIIEREGIEICPIGNGEFYGDTPLIAAMRCYVASKLGDEVEIPEELT